MRSTNGVNQSLVYDGLQASSFVHDVQNRPLQVSVLYVDIVGFSRFDQSAGRAQATEVLEVFSSMMKTRVNVWFVGVDVRVLHIWDDGFAVVVHGDDSEIHAKVCYEFVDELEYRLNEYLASKGYPRLRLRYGYVSDDCDHSLPDELDQLYGLITHAGRAARRAVAVPPRQSVDAFQVLLQARRVETLYQPIVRFESQSTVGWESLSRGPIGSPIENPKQLFECADQLGYLFELEGICRSSAISNTRLIPGTHLFLNVHPRTFSDPSFRQGQTQRLIEAENLKPEQIVFEITEHQAVEDYALFNRLIDHYRNQGFKIAIDDTGAGYSGLVTLMEVKPDFVKVDMALVRSIHEDDTKRSIVAAINTVSRGFGATVIAEGIETLEEYRAVIDCGVECGQGYLFGRPGAAMGLSPFWTGIPQ